MIRKLFLMTIGILLTSPLVACEIATPSSTTEGTLTIKSNFVFTQTPNKTGDLTISNEQSTNTPEIVPATLTLQATTALLSTTVQEVSSSYQLDPEYFQGLIILTQYYTLLDHGLYEESYQLLSSSQQDRYSIEEYTDFYSQDLKAIKIKDIQPYNYWRTQHELPVLQIPSGELRYIISLTAYHTGAAWNEGGTPTPDEVTGFETLILENSEWKIDQFNTSPWTH